MGDFEPGCGFFVMALAMAMAAVIVVVILMMAYALLVGRIALPHPTLLGQNPHLVRACACACVGG